MAQHLRHQLELIGSIQILFPTEANAVFARIPEKKIQAVHERGWHFYTDVGPGGSARLMCSWDTTEEDIDNFCKDLEVLSP
jgi:threonine aldolase